MRGFKMKTLFLVMAQYGTAEIPLEQLCSGHFGMNLGTATKKAALHELPVPFYKKTGKSGYFCSASDWANYLDAQAEKARTEWNKMNGIKAAS